MAVLLFASQPPIIIAHRGSSAERPEHTLAAYERAIDQGSDYIEPDLVISKDGVLIARHENEISGTTDVAARPEFADRKATKTIDGDKITGWFTEDFTLAELKTLRAKERLPLIRSASKAYDGQFEIPTLAEIGVLVKEKSKGRKRPIGMYPETKHPTYFRGIGLPLEEPLLKELSAQKLRRGYPIFIQSFEIDNLKALRKQTKWPLIQLIDADASAAKLTSDEGLKEIKKYADGIGVAKDLVISRENGNLGKPTGLVARAHRLGLKVHVWTFRPENPFLPKNLTNNPEEEIRQFLATGIDGLFADLPGMAVAVRDVKK